MKTELQAANANVDQTASLNYRLGRQVAASR
jgi:hypothetical protein